METPEPVVVQRYLETKEMVEGRGFKLEMRPDYNSGPRVFLLSFPEYPEHPPIELASLSHVKAFSLGWIMRRKVKADKHDRIMTKDELAREVHANMFGMHCIDETHLMAMGIEARPSGQPGHVMLSLKCKYRSHVMAHISSRAELQAILNTLRIVGHVLHEGGRFNIDGQLDPNSGQMRPSYIKPKTKRKTK